MLLTPPAALGAISTERLPQAGTRAATNSPQSANDAATTVGADQPPHPLVRSESGSRGVATGRVRIVSHQDMPPDVATGDVLVAHNAGPLWTPLFSVVAAVVLDQGDLFQHAMLTCREYGLPAVFQTKDGTQRLQEGQRVTVDGTGGWVVATDADGDSTETSADRSP